MSKESLIKNIKEAIKNSGYPLEQKVGHLLQKKGWHPFYSINYTDPISNKERELDILAFKVINNRRIELRISCKRSFSKPWILFTEDASRYLEHSSILKVTPVVSDFEVRHRILELLKDLYFFSHKRKAINYTALSKDQFNNDARSLIKDGLYSSLNSVYHRIFPDSLLFDTRGTIYFFVTVFEGELFESFYNPDIDDDEVNEIDYCIYDTRLKLISEKDTVVNEHGAPIKLLDVLYWFSDWFRVEVVTWKFFEMYLDNINKVFEKMNKDEIKYFGKSWDQSNFPKIVAGPPKI